MNRHLPWIMMALTIAVIAAAAAWVDLAPKVETDFFFSRDDPQLVTSAEIERRFPAGSQVFVRAPSDDIRSGAYRDMVAALADDLAAIEGVSSVQSVANTDAFDSPVWSRMLISPDSQASNLLLSVTNDDTPGLVAAIETVTANHADSNWDLRVSGVPYVIELIRRNLWRDLLVFSAAALAVFGLLTALLYRRIRIVVGTLTTCLSACAVTLLITRGLDISIGLLTANLITIVFVLTLSHIVFLTGNWQRIAGGQADSRSGGQSSDAETAGPAVALAVRETFVPSFWSMATTLLGFLSLLLASAKPLRELGVAGAIGTATAIVLAYVMYPAFLKGTTPPARDQSQNRDVFPRRPLPWLPIIGFVVVVLAFGATRVSTDPSLLSYFGKSDPLRQGLEAIDRDGGSSPLNVVARDASGRTLDNDSVVQNMLDLQTALENDPQVGVVLSPAIVLAEARRAPFMARLTWKQLLDVPLVARLTSGFVSASREEGQFVLRMREGDRNERRADVIARVDETVRQHDLEPLLVGGLYDLQGQLGRLIMSSLRIGLGGLLLLFTVMALGLSVSGRTALTMLACLVAIPAVVIGTFGFARVPLDIITSPAANVALAMGVDSMIHLVVRTRRLYRGGVSQTDVWYKARAELWPSIVRAALIISVGFGIFSLSSFPPTQRFGVAVILGTVAAAIMALVGLPLAATAVENRKRLTPNAVPTRKTT